jgi:HPt (histidine-containing phosphotransfer) domain-containing protein
MDRSPAEESVDPALAEIWARNLPRIRDRLRTLELAARSLERNEPLDRHAATAAAHKLAGSLGSFGLARGSELGRELEGRFESSGGLGSPGEISHLVAELRRVIEA